MEVIGAIIAIWVVYLVINQNSNKKESTASFSVVEKIGKDGRSEITRTISGSMTSSEARTNFKNIQSGNSREYATGIHELREAKLVEGIDNRFLDPVREDSRKVINTTRVAIPKITMAQTKVCTKCNKPRNREDFFSSSKQADGLTAWCRKCHSQKSNDNSSRYKRCASCGSNRERWNFFKSEKQPDGLSKWCKPCHKKRK